MLALLQQHNKPFNVQNASDLLATQGVKKAACQKALDALVEQGLIDCKVSGDEGGGGEAGLSACAKCVSCALPMGAALPPPALVPLPRSPPRALPRHNPRSSARRRYTSPSRTATRS